MRNHFHLVIETLQLTLVAGMKWLLGTYTSRFNRRRRQFGHLFRGRYKALVVDGRGGGFLKTVCDDVHWNPVRAKVIPAGQPLEAFRWSNYPLSFMAASLRAETTMPLVWIPEGPHMDGRGYLAWLLHGQGKTS